LSEDLRVSTKKFHLRLRSLKAIFHSYSTHTSNFAPLLGIFPGKIKPSNQYKRRYLLTLTSISGGGDFSEFPENTLLTFSLNGFFKSSQLYQRPSLLRFCGCSELRDQINFARISQALGVSETKSKLHTIDLKHSKWFSTEDRHPGALLWRS